jgi:hypothetical protein
MKIVIALLILFMSICQIFGQTVQKTIKRLPDTGQTKSFTNTFGEDNDYIIFPPFFINHSNGTVTDTVTGLMWQQTDGGEMTFESAVTYTENLVLGGYDDWRLPTSLEAYTIMNHQNNNPAVDINYFTKTGAEYWWTADKQKNDANKIWVTNAGGGIGNHLKSETISAGGSKSYHARAVRNTYPKVQIAERFLKFNNDVVIDQLTNLMWHVKPSATALDWESALTNAESASVGGYTDWRLPNIKELQSLQDINLLQPCVNTTVFPAIGIKKYWSSTTLASQPTKAWYFDTNFGITTQDIKTNQFYTMLVRGGIEGTTTGLHEYQDFPAFISVYPNPATDFLQMDVDLPQSVAWQATLYDMYGKTIMCSPTMKNMHYYTFDLSDVKQGIYVLSIGTDAGRRQSFVLVVNR